MKAEVARNRAKLVEAEAQVPMALSNAFRKGTLQSSVSWEQEKKN